jgi:ectoine hydroxylase-related dioxygenase (phytanoyl-CoA dioxygenase family)
VPFIIKVCDPPNTTRPRHSHHGDVCYLYVQGEHHIEGEGVYREGDVRWTRAVHEYGPETTGSDGGTWWLVTSDNPIPVPAGDARVAGADPLPVLATRPAGVGLEELVALTTEPGGVIVTEWLDEQTVARVNDEIDCYLSEHPGYGAPDSGSELYDLFLGRRTVRLHGLVAKLPRTGPALIADPRLVEWATAVMAPICTSVLLNAAELIQIGPGEGTQFLHRDSDSWPALPPGPTPVIVNAIIALDEFTLDNGATHVAPGSHHWPAGRTARPDDLGRAVMRAGDVLLFRGDLVHGGGANTSDRRRRAISISYCAGWLRPVEHHPANLGLDAISNAPHPLRDLLGGGVHDATAKGGGILGLVEGRNPAKKR